MLNRPQPPPATCRDDESNTLEKQPFQTASMVKLFMRSIDIISTKLDAMSHVYCASQRHQANDTKLATPQTAVPPENSIPILTHQKTRVKQTGQNYDPVAALGADSTDPRLACS